MVNKFIKLTGTAVLFFIMLLMIQVFYTAYTNPSKTVLVDINEYKEAWVEAILIVPFIILVGVYSLVNDIKEVFKT